MSRGRRNVRRILALSLAAPLLGGVMGGCNLYRPGLFEPRTIEQQRYSASIHDPYGLPDAGPEMEGVRPRDFQQPSAEPARARWFAETWQGR
jgi:hypothetical protein